MKAIVTSNPVLLLAIGWLAGCDQAAPYKQTAQVAQESAERQAKQNTEMTRLNREVAQGARRLVEADAQARKEIIGVHQKIQTERLTLNDRFAALESERKQIAGQRRTESMLVAASKVVGIAAVSTVVIVFCWFLVFGLSREDASPTELNELLIEELVSEQPRLRDHREPAPVVPVAPAIEQPAPKSIAAIESANHEPSNQGETE